MDEHDPNFNPHLADDLNDLGDTLDDVGDWFRAFGYVAIVVAIAALLVTCAP